MEIGQLLKNYRNRNQITQKQMAKDVISVSFYSKVEAGTHKISAEDLLKILQKNGISYDSFFSNFSDESSLAIDTKESITKSLINAYFQGNSSKIKELNKNVSNSSKIIDTDKNLLYALIESIEVSLFEDASMLSEDNKYLLKDYLFNLPEWDHFKLSLFCNLMDIYDLNTNNMMVSSILRKDISTYLKKGDTIVVTILVNMVANCIENNVDQLALFYIGIIDSLTTTPNIFFEKLLVSFFSELIIYKKNYNMNSKEKIYQLIKLVSDSGMDSYSNALKEFVEKIE